MCVRVALANMGLDISAIGTGVFFFAITEKGIAGLAMQLLMEDGDDSGDSDFQDADLQDADLEDGDDSEDSDYADQAPARGNKRSVVKVPIRLSPLAVARKKMASQLKVGRHWHTRVMEEDNAKRVRTKMFEMTVS